MTTIALLANTPAAAHQAAVQLYQLAKQRPGELWEFRARTVDQHKRIAMRNAYHGIVIPDISMQARIWCDRSKRFVLRTPTAWKETFRELFIPPVVQEYSDRHGELKLRLVKRSTEDLTDDEFQEFLMKVQAFAVTELNVTFSEEAPE